jgi:2-amino-4-hydroxy-6-hydroxymethyldihydropteridine diphosphokinase
MRAYIGVGSNLGDRLAHCAVAVEALAGLDRTRVVGCSPWYETEPVGDVAQSWFVNGAVEVETALDPRELLSACLAIERTRGRERRIPNGPRTLDLDLLLYADQVSDEVNLTLPHPRLMQRAFVLIPLADIAPQVVHPQAGVTIAALRAQVSIRPAVRPYEPAALGAN